MDAQEAIAVLLEQGVAIEKNGVHLYKTPKGAYVLLYFDGRGNIRQDTDESFPESQDAIAKFVQKTQGDKYVPQSA